MINHQTSDILDFSSLSRDEIARLLQHYHLSLTIEEALVIQLQLLKRPPTIAECVLWSIQGSEHCSYKSTRQHLKKFLTEGPHVILGPKEDAGIVAVAQDQNGKRYGIVMSHESHNHPSQIVPYEGAATGIGGNVRDVSCMGAEVIAIADSLRFGDLNCAKTHWINQGVVQGIGGYGNPLGIPNIAGDVYYHPDYNQNCLVTVVSLGIVREDHIIHSYAPKDAEQHVFILVGKPTDNSGFGGASFASTVLASDQQEKNKGAVQEPNAFLQRHLLKANEALFKKLREKNLLSDVGFKDLGAGGIACASVELAEAGGYGAEINLDAVRVSMPHLPPEVVLCAETQERFMWVVPPNLVDMMLEHYNQLFALPAVSFGAQATVIGNIRPDGDYIVKSGGKQIVHAKAKDITKGIVYDRPYSIQSLAIAEFEPPLPDDLQQTLLSLLAHENIASRAVIFETYDKQVQGRTVVEAGCADAGVLQPFNDDEYPAEIRATGIALSIDHNPRYSKISAYWGGVQAVLEAVRNVVAVGATPLAITDCLCFGNPEHPERMGELLESIRGINDACRAIYLKEYPAANLPVIAGNVSLYNESRDGKSIPPSPIISCLGALPDVSKALTFALKSTDSLLIMVGERHEACGGSVYYQLHQQLGATLPEVSLATFTQEIHAIYDAVQADLVLSAHDISEGGIAVALAEMSFKHQIGVNVSIPGEMRIDQKLFGEAPGFVLEIPHNKLNALRQIFADYQIPFFIIGRTTKEASLKIEGCIDLPIKIARDAWEKGLREKLI